jgi:hypothetical protein
MWTIKADHRFGAFYNYYFIEEGEGGYVFAAVFNMADREGFALSQFSVASGVVILKPQLEGEWCGMQWRRHGYGHYGHGHSTFICTMAINAFGHSTILIE